MGDKANVISGNIVVGADNSIGFGVSSDPQVLEATGPQVHAVTSDPNGNLVAPIGSIALRGDTGALYQNTDGLSTWVQVETTLSAGNTFALEFTVPANPGESVTKTMPKDGTWFLATALATAGAVDTGVIVYNDTKSGSPAITFNFESANATEVAGLTPAPGLSTVTRDWDQGDSIRLLFDEGTAAGKVYIQFITR
jgi:hypothetical protein